jgi:hypothetical protein
LYFLRFDLDLGFTVLNFSGILIMKFFLLSILFSFTSFSVVGRVALPRDHDHAEALAFANGIRLLMEERARM